MDRDDQAMASRRLTAGIRLYRHGQIVGGATPWEVSVERLEAIADDLDRRSPEKAWNPITGPWTTP